MSRDQIQIEGEFAPETASAHQSRARFPLSTNRQLTTFPRADL
ncbi:MAG: hypothetical protein ACFB4I_18695 [Cyanophyceae cyanobacterium]